MVIKIKQSRREVIYCQSHRVVHLSLYDCKLRLMQLYVEDYNVRDGVLSCEEKICEIDLLRIKF